MLPHTNVTYTSLFSNLLREEMKVHHTISRNPRLNFCLLISIYLDTLDTSAVQDNIALYNARVSCALPYEIISFVILFRI